LFKIWTPAEGYGEWGEVVQTMYTHITKYKNDKRREKIK
jgi:hypothetical protein